MLESLAIKEGDILDTASDLLGISSSTLGLSKEDNKRVIDLKRKFPKKAL